jgi:ribose 5-phosphate isomerase
MASEEEKELAGRASLQFVHDGDDRGSGLGLNGGLCHSLFRGARSGGHEDSRYCHIGPNSEPGCSLGITLTTLEEVQRIDVTIDGADEFDQEL